MRALIVADGDVPDRATLDGCWPGWSDGVQLVIGADAGYLRAKGLKLAPDLFVGDADSLPAGELERIRDEGIRVELAPAAKDESDAELALLAAVTRGATSVTVLGALGGPRFDHALANVWLLALPAAAGVDVELLDDQTRVRLVRAPVANRDPAEVDLSGAPGDLVTLLPFTAVADGITTSGLRYPLTDDSLRPGPARGLSNVRIAPDASLSLRRGQLLVIETRI